MSGDGKKKFPVNEKPKMMSLDELRKRGGGGEDEDRGTFYAGGEKSGMAIEGADKPHLSAVKKLLEQAQKNSIERGSSDEEEEEGKEKVPFTGRGNRLSDQNNNEDALTSSTSNNQRNKSKVTRMITFWKNGFTFSDQGPLYDYENPENQRTLALMQSGQVPLKVLDLAPGQSVDMKVVHRVNEDFVVSAVEKTRMPFEGKGHRLGDMASPPTVSSSHSNNQTTSSSEANVPRVDASLPQTTLQVRFNNGTRKTLNVNTNFTIKELHEYAKENISQSGSITLLHGRPPLPLNPTDESTLQQAGLLNTVIIQQ